MCKRRCLSDCTATDQGRQDRLELSRVLGILLDPVTCEVQGGVRLAGLKMDKQQITSCLKRGFAIAFSDFRENIAVG